MKKGTAYVRASLLTYPTLLHPATPYPTITYPTAPLLTQIALR